MVISIGIREEISAKRWEFFQSLLCVNRIEILLKSAELSLNVKRRLIIDILKQFVKVLPLRFPFGVLAVSEIVSQWN